MTTSLAHERGPEMSLSPRLRVAFVTNMCPHYRRPLFELLAQRFDVDFYFFSDQSERYWSPDLVPERGEFNEVRLRRLSVGGHALLPELATRLTPARYDVVVKCLNGRLMVPFVFSLARLRRMPTVLWTGMWHHPQTLAHRLTAPLTRAVYARADAIVVYGSHVERYLAQERVDPAKIFVAGQAVPEGRFSRVEPDYGSGVILYVGQLEERKGLRDLVEAFALAPSSARLRIVGSGSLESLVREAAARDPRIELAGHVPQERLAGEYQRAACVVLPSVTTSTDRETWGLVVNEAMTAGLPVIATDAVGAAAGGLVVDGRNGLVVAERTPRALAGALITLAADRTLAADLGRRARADVADYTYPRMADAFAAAVSHARRVRGIGRVPHAL